jgi:pyruvate dehydrogenase E1 component alpha subunit
MASLWNLPFLFFCENNRYAMGTEVERGSAGGDAFHKKLYNVPGIRFGGHDMFEVREAVRFAK